MPTILDEFEPAPGFLIGRPVKREELQSQGGLSLPSSVGKVSDSVALAEVLKVGAVRKVDGEYEYPTSGMLDHPDLEVGDIVGYMPYTDKLLEIDLENYAVVAYKQIMLIKRAS